ncbi:invasion associated locus B family protein [Jhaorihella thermophila]
MGKKLARVAMCLSLAGMVFTATAGVAAAQEKSSNRVAAKTDWSVFVEENPKECWAVSAPKKTVNTRNGRVVAVRRGDILLFVFYRPEAKVKGQVTFTGGYPFAKGSTVNLDIGGTEFELFTDGEWAWPATSADDAKIIAAMKRGTNAVLTARSQRGTQTKDTFSLLGFTAAVEDAEKALRQVGGEKKPVDSRLSRRG